MTPQDGRRGGTLYKEVVPGVAGAAKCDLPQMADGTHNFVISGAVVPQVKTDDQHIFVLNKYDSHETQGGTMLTRGLVKEVVAPSPQIRRF